MASRASVELHTLIYFKNRYIPSSFFLNHTLILEPWTGKDKENYVCVYVADPQMQRQEL